MNTTKPAPQAPAKQWSEEMRERALLRVYDYLLKHRASRLRELNHA